ncbi:MAG: signal recognition particle-docking protein FtsY [Thermodesulfobacteriota bacterium]
MSWLSKQLEKTRRVLTTPIDELFTGKKDIGPELLEELEEALILADVGVSVATELMERLRSRVDRREVSDVAGLRRALGEEVLAVLAPCKASPFKPKARPHVILVAGVNGVGKTTTIGKLAAQFAGQGKKVMVVAADTFRAAAVEQLVIWAERAGVDIVKHKGTADPAAVVYDGMEAAVARGTDLVLVDTAGRLHTKVNLMEELKKVYRTAGKCIHGAPHDVWLVLDAATGGNAVAQARLFNEAISLTGLVVTKLDGTAKAGALIGICHEMGLPVRYIGLGEKMSDLKEFAPEDYVAALF